MLSRYYEYEIAASANLAATAFEISQVGETSQALRPSLEKVTWEWNLLPKEAGKQIINVSISVQWMTGENLRILDQTAIWRSRHEIVVTKSIVDIGQINIFSIISGFLGSALAMPWVYERIREAVEKRRDEEAKRPRILKP